MYVTGMKNQNLKKEQRRERTKMTRQNQEGKGLKILTLQQILSRLPISLAQ